MSSWASLHRTGFERPSAGSPSLRYNSTRLDSTLTGRGERSIDVARRRDAAPVPRLRRDGDLFPTCFVADALDPFSQQRSLSDVFNVVDRMLDIFPFGAGWRGWDAREDLRALYLKGEMPGLGKDDVQRIARW
ncbi:heat shock 22 kDa protein, mitochondrial-like [Zingiber officinale]|uniref:heat shock 22 kDa protein, mitochondrial-like n=1 Tax=Zingiber officinale TaxID=94328 RepID=UPI001C4C94CB|nr:heat shock 22 kDa protein, mitochondrial-like [Zingiber officinale]